MARRQQANVAAFQTLLHAVTGKRWHRVRDPEKARAEFLAKIRGKPKKAKTTALPHKLIDTRSHFEGTGAKWRLDVDLPIETVPEANRASHEHWRVRQKRAKAQRSATTMLLRVHAQVPPSFPCTIRMIRVAPCRLDRDGCVSSLKSVQDGVADWIGMNDRDPRLDWQYDQERHGARTYGVRIVFEWIATKERVETGSE